MLKIIHHGNISVEENHKLVNDTIKTVCDRLNSLGVDYYVVGALSAFMATNTPLFRYHGDIDFMIAEKDIDKVRMALQGTDYNFSDDRLNNEKKLDEGVGHTRGEHEVIANHKKNEFHLGFFLFRREPDNAITVREYFMKENENGNKEPMVLERHYPKELAELEYPEDKILYGGTEFRTNSPESVYLKKLSTRHPKDMLDLKALEDKMDYEKMEEMKKYSTTQRIVKPNELEKEQDDKDNIDI